MGSVLANGPPDPDVKTVMARGAMCANDARRVPPGIVWRVSEDFGVQALTPADDSRREPHQKCLEGRSPVNKHVWSVGTVLSAALTDWLSCFLQAYSGRVTVSASAPAKGLEGLPAEVLDALVQAAQVGLRHLEGGCMVHTTGRVTWCGLTAKVKPILWEAQYGRPVPVGSNLLRRCPSSTPGCIQPLHIISVPRSEWGRALGRPGGLWRPARAA